MQAGRAAEIPPLNPPEKAAVIAYQRAQNKALADLRKNPRGGAEEE